MIVGGALGGIATGILVGFLIFRWWLKQNRQKRALVGPDGLAISPYTDENSHPTYFAAPPPYPSKGSGFSPQATWPRVIGHQSVSTLVGATPETLENTLPEQRSVSNGRTEMVQVQQALPIAPLMQGKAQSMGNGQLSSVDPVSSPPSHVVPSIPEGTKYAETVLPAYSCR